MKLSLLDSYTQGRTAMCLLFCSSHSYMFFTWSLIMYNIYMLSWDDIGGKRLLSTARTQQHADDLVDEYSEMYPNAYVDYEKVA